MKVNGFLISIFVFFITLYCFPGLSAPAPGIYGYGTSVPSAGIVGSGVSTKGVPYFGINPAVVSSLERYALTLDYGSLDGDFHYPAGTLLLPSSRGVFGISWKGFQFKERGNDNFTNFFSFGMGKLITDRLSLGLATDWVFNPGIYGGLKAGLLYTFPLSLGHRGFVFDSPTLGFSGGGGFHSDPDLNYGFIAGGGSFIFYRQSDYSLGLSGELRWNEGTRSLPVKLGLEFSYHSWLALRSGVVLPGNDQEISYSAGASFMYVGKNAGGSLDYSCTYSRSTNLDHRLGITLEYGEVDREGPETEITPNRHYISPNDDGVQDFVTFETSVRDRSLIKSWSLDIRDLSGRLVKRFTLNRPMVESELTPSSLVKRFFGVRESVIVPEKLLWDGKASRGKRVPDGKYLYAFSVRDGAGNVSTLKKGALFVDTKKPSVNIDRRGFIFSPNGDGNRDLLKIPQRVDSSPGDRWVGVIKNDKGETLRRWVWSGGDVPSNFVWDGLDSAGQKAPEGLYSYEVTCSDRAGNRASARIRDIVLVRHMGTVDVTASVDFFSAKKFGQGKTISFFPEVSERKGVERWELSIFKDDGLLKSIVGTGDVPAVLLWDGRDSNGDPLADGEYYFLFRVWYVSGNNPQSFKKRIVADSNPPALSIKHSPDLFSPDDDGINDYLSIFLEGEDSIGINGWELRVLSERGVPFKVFSGVGNPPEMLKWDGVGDRGDLVESASDYTLEFTATDFAGNKSEAVRDRVPVDVLVVVTERGLKMRISNVTFNTGSAKIRKRGRRILNRVHSILERYGKFNVVIEGHTDNRGKRAYNQKLSLARALSVKKYLVGRGVPRERLTCVGFGETMPFYPNTSVENRRRNRRVEFLLVEKSTPEEQKEQNVNNSGGEKGQVEKGAKEE